MLELLAPAGDIESFNAAVNSGADAVYLGLQNFNARLKADNFTENNITEYIRKAHFYGVKVYITVNTIVQNNEFNELISLVKTAVNAKADAFLVQDLGVAKVLLGMFPGIVLHASTQMGIHNLYGAKIAEKIGIKRVVLSRETKLEDIREIKKNTNLEIEYFIHGALCIAFSGNCYMSSLEQNASGNRGMCKQLCRLPYTAEYNGQKQSGYLLSARDLCLADNLKELADAGVSSFKIEGRMRRPGYVASAVSVYRKLIDGIGYGKKLSKTDTLTLKTAFSRGEYLSRAYLDSGTPFIVEKNYGNHTGIEIGRVKSVQPFKEDLYKVEIISDREIHDGDGLKFFDGTTEKASLGVGDCRNISKGIFGFVTKTKVKPGYTVNLILDSETEEKLLGEKRLIPVNITVKAIAGEKLSVKCRSNSIETVAESVEPLEAAQNVPVTSEEIIKQVSKVGDLGFSVAGVEVETDGVFIAKSVINQVRRDASEALREAIIRSNEPEDVKITEFNIHSVEGNKNPAKECQIINEDTKIVKHSDLYIISPDVYSVTRVNELIKNNAIPLEKAVLKLPLIASGEDLKILDRLIEESGIKTLLSENLYGLIYKEKGYDLIAGTGHNTSNTYASEMLKNLGCTALSKSIEFKEYESVLPEIIIENELPVMTFAHCPVKTLTGCDCTKCMYRKGMKLSKNGHKYKVRRVRLDKCYFELIGD
ncbi:MAG: U32 family peptidase [Clostridia bacterium]|nr:U32 family peptidase [Clostridia bacterium]